MFGCNILQRQAGDQAGDNVGIFDYLGEINMTNICRCCGFHFGFDDDDMDDKKLYTRYGTRNGLMEDVYGFPRVGNLIPIGTL